MGQTVWRKDRPETAEEVNKEEAKKFAAARDANFEKARDTASAALAKELDTEAILSNPDKYFRYLFLKVGTRVVKQMMPQAKAAGKKYAEGLQQTRNRDS